MHRKWILLGLGCAFVAVAVVALTHFSSDNAAQQRHDAEPARPVASSDNPARPDPGKETPDQDAKPAKVPKPAATDLESSDDYASLVERIQPLADLGDPESQRKLALIYEDCFGFSVSREGFEALYNMAANAHPESAARAEWIKNRRIDRCKNLNHGEFTVPDLMYYWWEEAAKNGDARAKVRVAREKAIKSPDSISREEVNSIVSEAFSSGDPGALLEMASVLGLLQADEFTKLGLGSGDISRSALEIAACRLGMACGMNSRLMFAMCVGGNAGCSYPNYEAYVLDVVIPPASRPILEDEISRIIARAGRKP